MFYIIRIVKYMILFQCINIKIVEMKLMDWQFLKRRIKLQKNFN